MSADKYQPGLDGLAEWMFSTQDRVRPISFYDMQIYTSFTYMMWNDMQVCLRFIMDPPSHIPYGTRVMTFFITVSLHQISHTSQFPIPVYKDVYKFIHRLLHQSWQQSRCTYSTASPPHYLCCSLIDGKMSPSLPLITSTELMSPTLNILPPSLYISLSLLHPFVSLHLSVS